ncbi:hypothetical protein ACFO26_06250 [Lactococcus nasutitermitis]|uniref:Uncharacterized protein n=1 Tax=Lactococcus nasutitermitis TaxID=1652957 RepID=A0ABV9JG82_9LACT|nr:hypothetical protein [Lactococcus nasutitermitis]
MRLPKNMTAFSKKYKLGHHLLPLLGTWLDIKHFGLIREALLDDEEVAIAFEGRFQPANSIQAQAGKENKDKVKWRTTKGYYAFAVTNRQRLIYAHWRPFHHTVESIRFDRMTDVKIATGVFMGRTRVGTLEDDFYIYFFSGTIKRIGKILQTAAIEKRVVDMI